MGKRRLYFLLSTLVGTACATLPAAVAQERDPLSVERPRLLAFGSSDSCEWCKLLERRVFATDAWRAWADAHLEFVRVDLPRRDGVLAPEERERNNALADRLGVTGIPTFVLLAPDGDVELGRVKVPDSSRGLGRDVTPEAFIAAVASAAQERAPSVSVAQERDPPLGEAASRRFWRIYRFIPVVLLLGIAAYLLVDKSKLPLALRGLKKVLGNAVPAAHDAPPVPAWKRWLAFVLVLVAFLLAVI